MSRRRHLVALPLALMVSALVACTDVPRIPPPEPPASSEPLFASDEEALEAATAAYEEYLAVSGAVTSSATLDTALLTELVTSEYLLQEQDALQEFASRDLRTSGISTLQSASLQQQFDNERGFATVIIYACVNVGGVRVIDNSGSDVTPEGRPEISALEVELIADSSPEPGANAGLLVSRSQAWTESAICG